MKKLNKTINELYDYYKTTRVLPPRGDGAKLECAKEVHQVSMKLFNMFEHAKTPNDRYKMCLMLLELAEQMVLDNIDTDFTVEEMCLYE